MKKSRAGFTLLEMLVVIGITTLLAAVAITYSKVGQNETALTVETSKIAELILQAKELAINTYGATAVSGYKACGFGVHFDFSGSTPTYSLFAYSVVDNGTMDLPCPSLASTTEIGLVGPNGEGGIAIPQEYQPSSWEIPLAQGVTMSNTPANTLTDVIFYPPVPTTLITQDDSGGYVSQFLNVTSYIHLSTTDGRNSSTIAVSPEGQVSF
jgi:prepilin-type N-terminal cleavage/methylation domain-containing protein